MIPLMTQTTRSVPADHRSSVLLSGSLRWLCRLMLLGSACGVDAGQPVPMPTPSPAQTHSALTGSLFDLAAIRDASTADCHFDNEHTVLKNGVLMRVWNVSYLSWEWRKGEGGFSDGLQPIRIRAFAARPVLGPTRLPAVVLAHGLGGLADENSALSSAARLGLFVLAYTGPGGGNRPDNRSEGKPASDGSGYRMFDTLGDVRGSWFWAHTTAALRGLTCVSARAEVDGTKLGMTGFSAGGVATLLASGADSRIKAAVPLSGVLAWEEAVRSGDAWQHGLLRQAGLSTASAEWTTLIDRLISSPTVLGSTSAALLLVNGSSDEFFPLTAHLTTLRGLPAGTNVRTSLVGNFDHGCYKVSGGERASTIEARATVRAEGGQRAFFRHHLLADPAYPAIPRPPTVAAVPIGAATQVIALVDCPAGLEIDEVRLWWSTDNALLFGSVTLSSSGSNRYEKLVPLPLSSGSAYYVDVQYRTRDLLAPQRFAISSEPVLAAGLLPRIRSMTTCL
jgi:dienelactone hydrolase